MKLNDWKWKDNMSLIHEEWGIITHATEMDIGKKSTYNLNDKDLNLHHEKI